MGSGGKIFATIFVHFVISFNLIMQNDHVQKKMKGSAVCGQIIAYHVAAFLINSTYNMTRF